MGDMAETNKGITYPRPARSFNSSYGWRAMIEIAPGQYEPFGKFDDELDADAAAKAVCIGLKEIQDYEYASETKAD